MRTINVAGGTLFHLAADLYGDATQWTRLAEANSLADPRLDGVMTLRVPAPVSGRGEDG